MLALHLWNSIYSSLVGSLSNIPLKSSSLLAEKQIVSKVVVERLRIYFSYSDNVIGLEMEGFSSLSTMSL